MKRLLCLFILTVGASVNAGENNKYIPASCNTLMGLNVAKITKIPAFQAILNDTSNTDLNELKSYGLSPDNISSVLIGMDTNKAATDPINFEKNPDVIIIATMNNVIDISKILESAKKEKVTIKSVNYKGVPVTLMTKEGKTMALTSLGEKTLAIGGSDMIKRAILLKQGESKDSFTNNKELSQLIKTEKMLWLVGNIPAMPAVSPEQAMGNPMANAATQIKAFTLDGDYAKELAINANLLCKTAQAAAQLSAMGQMVLGMATSNPDSPIKPGALKLTTEESTIKISLNLDQETIQKMTAMAAPMVNAPK
jgi:hypothetical protein